MSTRHFDFNYTIYICCKTVLLTGQEFIDLLPFNHLLTDGLIFIGSIRNSMLASQCQGVVEIYGRDEREVLKTGNGYVGGKSE